MIATRMKAFAIGLGIFAVGVGGFFLLTQTKPVAEVRDATTAAWRVSAVTIELNTINPVFNGFGTVENPDTQVLKARLATDVNRMLVREGARVQAGQPLAMLSAIDAEIKLSQARASLADAEANLANLDATELKDREALILDQQTLKLREQNLERMNDLRKRNLASTQNVDEAEQALVTQKLQINRRELALATVEAKRAQLKTTIERFKAEVRAAEFDLASTQVVAPADGQVVAVHAVAGDRVQANQNLITFSPDFGREIRIQVPAATGRMLAQSVFDRQPVDATTTQGHRLELARVAGAVRDNTGSLDVFFSSLDPLPPTGTVVSVSIELPAEDAVAVLPTDALYGGDLVYRITADNRLEGVSVERLGRRPGESKTQILVRSPKLNVGDRILISRLPAAVTGLQVEVIE